MTLKRKAEVLDKIMHMLGKYEINGIELFDSDEELERFFVCELNLTDKEIKQLGFELYV